MEQQKFLISFICLLSSALRSTGAAEADDIPEKVKLFVFGDSYADTGNSPSPVSIAWKPPYGITFPGKPSGRFSDGRVLTDYIATFLGISPPFPYQMTKNFDTKTLTRHGINFAHGGTGVFTTLVDQPNMTTQIDFFQQLIKKNVYTTQDLSSSIALVSLAGNDYAAYFAKRGSFEGLPEFRNSVIEQLMLNVRRINSFGIKKIALTGIGPLGCLPQITASISYENCNAAQNNFTDSHNQLLKQHIWALNYETGAPVFRYLDLYSAFISALDIDQNTQGNLSNKLKPCCTGACGFLDKNGKKNYVVCENPNNSFFWDSIHPSNYGWGAVFAALSGSLPPLLL